MTESQQAHQPMFGGIYGKLSNPARQVLLMGAVWKLAQEFPGTPLRVLEIGSWSGLSTLSFAWALNYFGAGGTIHCVDPWMPYVDKSVNRVELYDQMDAVAESGEIYDVYRHNVSCGPDGVDITHSRGMSQEVLPTLEGGSFDLVYVDGDHIYAAALSDIAEAKRLVGDSGMVTGDDLEVQAHECHAAINDLDPNMDFVTDTDAGISFHPGVTRAVGESFGPVSCWSGFWAMQRRDNGWAEISLEGIPFKLPPHLPKGMAEIIKEELLS